MKLGIFLPNWIGDAVMATPALRALRNHFRAPSRLVGILRPYVVDVLAGTPFLDELIVHDPKSQDRRRHTWGVIRALRRERLDCVVLFTNSFRTGLLAWASGASERIGYARNGRGPLLTRKLHALRAGRRFVPFPALDYYLDLAYALGCAPESARMELATSREDELAADNVWRELRLPNGREAVGLNTGGAFGSAKLWPTGYFSMLARRIAVERGRAVLVFCGPNEQELAREIVRGAAHPAVRSLADWTPSIGLSKACIRRCALLVSTDSGPRHFAGAFDVPCVTLFGPTHVAWSENHHPGALHLQREVPCGPCQQRVCPLGHHRCMTDLTVDEVYRAVAGKLDQQERTGRSLVA